MYLRKTLWQDLRTVYVTPTYSTAIAKAAEKTNLSMSVVISLGQLGTTSF